MSDQSGWEAARQVLQPALDEQQHQAAAQHLAAVQAVAAYDHAMSISSPLILRMDGVVSGFLGVVLPRLRVVARELPLQLTIAGMSIAVKCDWGSAAAFSRSTPSEVAWSFSVRNEPWEELTVRTGTLWCFMGNTRPGPSCDDPEERDVLFAREYNHVRPTPRPDIDWVGGAQRCMAAYLLGVGLPLPE